MNIRSLLLSLLAVSLICGLTYYNDAVLGQTFLIGNHMPIAVFGTLILFLYFVNNHLGKVSLKRSELALIVGISLSVCVVPASGLLRTFTTTLIMPQNYKTADPSFAENKIVESAPKQLLVDVTPENRDKVLGQFKQGKQNPETIFSPGKALAEVPWSAWWPTLKWWLPIILSFWICLIGLSLFVHKQWSEHELLPYPLAQFTSSLFPEEGKTVSSVFKDRLFWVSFLLVFGLYANNYLTNVINVYTGSSNWRHIPTQINIEPLLSGIAILEPISRWPFTAPTIFFSVIGFAYFLSDDVALSVGIGPFIYTYITSILAATYGISMGGGNSIASGNTFFTFGAYLGMFMMIVYTGRNYYASILKQSLCVSKAPSDDDNYPILGARLTMLGGLAMWGLLLALGLDWLMAAFYVVGSIILMLVLGRIIAETGLFFVQAYWVPCSIIIGFMGYNAVGPETALMMFILSMVLTLDPREALLPFMVNSLKIFDDNKVKLKKGVSLCIIFIVIGLGVALPVTLAIQYNTQAPMGDWWAVNVAPKGPFEKAIVIKKDLLSKGEVVLEQANSVSGFDRLLELNSQVELITPFCIGLGLFLLFSFLRLRFLKWPFHPVMFLICLQYATMLTAASFLIGWLVKIAVTKFGGVSVYQKLKPLMIGLITAELLAALIPVIIGFIYVMITGDEAVYFRVFPG